jgi:hypothetical protein
MSRAVAVQMMPFKTLRLVANQRGGICVVADRDIGINGPSSSLDAIDEADQLVGAKSLKGEFRERAVVIFGQNAPDLLLVFIRDGRRSVHSSRNSTGPGGSMARCRTAQNELPKSCRGMPRWRLLQLQSSDD